MDTATHMLRTGRRGALFELNMALRDVRASLQRIGLAWSLAQHDIVSRYRGSILGPFWITLSMGLMVAGIGLLNARLFRASLHDFIPFGLWNTGPAWVPLQPIFSLGCPPTPD